MQEMADLTGQRILLVEDNFFIASDTADLLTHAGAEVIGPSANVEDARARCSRRADRRWRCST